MSEAKYLAVKVLNHSKSIRYVAIYTDGVLFSQSRNDLTKASSPESDKYEELLVNPTLLLLTKQRGEINCGGCRFVLARYGNFYQLIKPIPNGHISICIEPSADPIAISQDIETLLGDG